MKDRYNELFDEIHLSETAKQSIEEKAALLYSAHQKKRKSGKVNKYIKAAVLIMVILAVGGTGTYAASQYNRQQDTHNNNNRLEHTLTDKRAEITVNTTPAQEKAGIAVSEAAVQEKTDKSFYDVKLSYLPEGYEQDKTDLYLYRAKDRNEFFSVILYRLQTDYHTYRTADQIKEFQTREGQGYLGGVKYRYYAIVAVKDKDYVIYIDGGNVPKKEIKKIAEKASLVSVKKKSDIQASYIEWTPELQKSADEHHKKVIERIGKR